MKRPWNEASLSWLATSYYVSLLQTQVFFNYFLFIAGAHLCLLCIHFAVMEINLNIVTAHVGGACGPH